MNAIVEAYRVGLESLRWKLDMQVTNYDGVAVWLGPCLNENGKRIGIMECCEASDPCAHHEAIANAR
jgi:hypothetical protein